MRYDLHRYHLTRKGRETTVSIDDILVEMLALKLGHDPDSDEARTAVRAWMQDRLDKSGDHGRQHLSQWLKARIVDNIVSDDLREAWGEWFDRAQKAGKYRQRARSRTSPHPLPRMLGEGAVSAAAKAGSAGPARRAGPHASGRR
jgi:hypothetical protein